MLLDEGKRVDSRSLTDVRPLASEVGVIPRVHWLRSVHPWTDAGTDELSPPGHPRGTLRNWTTTFEGDREALYAPLQLPGLFHRRGQGPPAVPAGVRSATALWLKRPCCPLFPPWKSSPIPTVWSVRSLSSNGSTSQGRHLRQYPCPDGCRRAYQSAGGRHFLRPW